MPDVGKIITALDQALESLGKAESAIGVARAGAATVESRTAEVGFLGIAAGIRQLGELLARVRQAHTNVGVDTVAPRTRALQVPADMRPADVIASLTPGLQRIESASANVAVVLRELEAAIAQTNASLDGGAPEKMLGLLAEIEQAMTLTVARLAEAKARTEEVIAQARALGNFPAGVAA
jgi:hypothetical protein